MNQVFRRSAAASSAAAIVATSWRWQQNTATSCEQTARNRLIFLGTGSSTGCPKPLCALLFQDEQDVPKELLQVQKRYKDMCRTSKLAMKGDPRTNKNYRNNPSLLISFENKEEDKEIRNVIIDVGKTFRETALRWMPLLQIHSLDAVILTHHHMDAVAGLDDLRGFQMAKKVVNETPVRVPMDIFLSQECLDQVRSQFPWLFPKVAELVRKPTVVVKRDVAALRVNTITEFEPFNASGLHVTPLPVWHGDDLICMGFAFTVGGTNVLYLSDISRMKPETMEYIRNKLPPTDLFIVDTLLQDAMHPVHFNLEQATSLAKNIKAKKTFLVGVNCDAFLPHDEMNAKLASSEEIDIIFAHDGLVVDL